MGQALGPGSRPTSAAMHNTCVMHGRDRGELRLVSHAGRRIFARQPPQCRPRSAIGVGLDLALAMDVVRAYLGRRAVTWHAVGQRATAIGWRGAVL